MTLITCYECDRVASDQAAACPHCGASIAKQPVPLQTQSSVPVSRSVGFWLGVGIFYSLFSASGFCCGRDIALAAG